MSRLFRRISIDTRPVSASKYFISSAYNYAAISGRTGPLAKSIASEGLFHFEADYA